MHLRARALYVLIPLILFAFLPTIASATSHDPCPGEGKIATAADSGYPVGSKICPKTDEKPMFGGCEENPYPYLEARNVGRKNNSFLAPATGGKGLGTNATLACRLKKLFEYMDSQGCKMMVNSAMRPVQTCTPGRACAPQGASCHQYGLAVDVGGTEQCLQRLTQIIGRKNPSSPYKLHVAYQEGAGAGYRHVQCIENMVAGCSIQTKGCGGPANVNPNPNEIPAVPPSAPLAQTFRNFISPQPPQPPSLTNNPLPASSNPLQFFPTQAQGQAQPIVSPPTTNYIPPTTPATIIQNAAGFNTTAPTPTATSSPLSTTTADDLRNNAVVAGTNQTTSQSGTTTVTLTPTSGIQQTFPDYTVAPPTHATYEAGTFAALYTLMIRVEELLAYLQPFRGSAFGPPAGSEGSAHEEHSE